MHHRHAVPPLSARAAGALTRWGRPLRAFRRFRLGRVLLAGTVTTVVTGLVLVVPVVSGIGSESSSVLLDSSSSVPSPAVDDSTPVVPEVVRSAAAPGTTAAVPDAATTAPTASSTTDPSTSSSRSPSSSASSSSSPVAASSPSSSSAGTPSSSAGPSGSSSPAPGTPSTAAASPMPAVPADLSPADELLALLDRNRAAAGCDPLSPDDDLAEAALEHSATMRDEDFLGLADDDGDPLLEQADARAGWVARGTRSPEEVVGGWLAHGGAGSLQDCTVTAVGIGRAGGDDGPWWTVLLA